MILGLYCPAKPWPGFCYTEADMPKKAKQQISNRKIIYAVLIAMLPIYAAFAVQFVPRAHHGTYDGMGWPFLVCGPVDSLADIGLLLANASIIISAIYILVLLSAAIRFKYFNQAADGTPLKKSKKKH